MAELVSGVLTDREAEILLAVADADSMEHAADRLGMSAESLRSATLRIRRKLGVKTNLQALRKLQRGVRWVTTRTVHTEARLEEIADG